jgi:hypothetical protein
MLRIYWIRQAHKCYAVITFTIVKKITTVNFTVVREASAIVTCTCRQVQEPTLRVVAHYKLDRTNINNFLLRKGLA